MSELTKAEIEEGARLYEETLTHRCTSLCYEDGKGRATDRCAENRWRYWRDRHIGALLALARRGLEAEARVREAAQMLYEKAARADLMEYASIGGLCDVIQVLEAQQPVEPMTANDEPEAASKSEHKRLRVQRGLPMCKDEPEEGS